ncbi:ankyrin repeat-containing domain protein [Geranomyces variabilis]|nr:ankyrin repeat-containing domain protein [Geranomyces variabilis]
MGNQPSGMEVAPDGHLVMRYLVRAGDVQYGPDGHPVSPVPNPGNGPAPTFLREEHRADGMRHLHFNMGSGSEAQLRAYQLEMRQNGNNIHLLHHAAQHGQVDVLARLLDAGADIDRDGNNREKALHTAVQFGRLEVVQSLLARGADPNATADWPFPASPRIMTPIHYAVLFHSCTQAGVQLSLQMVNALLDAGANPHSPPGVFRFACKEGRYDVATCILDRGGFPAPYPAGDRSALLFSLSYAVTSTRGMDRGPIALMVSRRLDLDPTLILTVNDYEPEDEMKGHYTPLIEDPYKILGRANCAGRQRQTPLLAVARGEPPLDGIMDDLLDLGADPNQAVSETGATVLHLLATPPSDEAPDAAAVKLLLARGADASLHDAMGRTAAEVATHSAIKTLLQSQKEMPPFCSRTGTMGSAPQP